MGDVAVRVDGLGKMFRIGGKQASYNTFRDTLADVVTAPFRRAGRVLRGQSYGASDLTETIWALKDVSFEVKRGEVIGIIGRNGAGKSTLLKILSRITEPTEGKAQIYGRVGALLEVGTGFHPELTGRENIFLNGAILGMSRTEINRKFDEIVAFAEVEKFIDTPVKHYSSGMGLRLGFAVAAHMEPEILIVDEVLAVGDAAFQKKCLGKMGEVAEQGRTVLFVSHNMMAIRSLCSRAILLRQGMVDIDNNIDSVLDFYVNETKSRSSHARWTGIDAPGNENARIVSIRILDGDGLESEQIALNQAIAVEVEYVVLKSGKILNLSLSLFHRDETYVLASPSFTDRDWYVKPHPAGLYRSVCVIPASFLNEGKYSLTLILVENGGQILAQLDQIVAFNTIDMDRKSSDYFGYWGGVVRPTLMWKTVQVSEEQALT